MSKKVVIIVSLILATFFTFAVVRSVNVKYADLKKTVDVVKTTQFIPAGSEIRADQVETVKIPEVVGRDLVHSADEVIGKAAKVGLIEGQYIFPGTAENAARRQGMVEVHVPVDISSSACVTAGDVVDVLLTDKGQAATTATPLYQGARVTHSFDQNGSEISPVENKHIGSMTGPPGSRAPVSVGLEVSREAAAPIAQAASKKSVYLVKSN